MFHEAADEVELVHSIGSADAVPFKSLGVGCQVETKYRSCTTDRPCVMPTHLMSGDMSFDVDNSAAAACIKIDRLAVRVGGGAS